MTKRMKRHLASLEPLPKDYREIVRNAEERGWCPLKTYYAIKYLRIIWLPSSDWEPDSPSFIMFLDGITDDDLKPNPQKPKNFWQKIGLESTELNDEAEIDEFFKNVKPFIEI